MNPSILRIHDVTLLAENAAELRAFYRSLGFTEIFSKGDDLVVFAAGDAEFAIHSSHARPRAAMVVAFHVSDLQATVEHLRRCAVSFEGPIQLRPGMQGVKLRDPNGNSIEFLAKS